METKQVAVCSLIDASQRDYNTSTKPSKPHHGRRSMHHVSWFTTLLTTRCDRDYTKYTCPKCNIRYCSITCYKKHSDNCTQQFESENLVEMLKNKSVAQVPDDVRLKTLQMLKRLSEANDSDDEDIQYNDLPLDQLPPDIIQDFEKSLRDGRMSSWLQAWNPWWCQNEPKFVVDIPPLSQLSRNISPDIIFYVVDILFAYVYTERIFNGEATDDDNVPDSVNLLYEVSPTLRDKTHRYNSVEDLFDRYNIKSKEIPTIFEDVRMILEQNAIFALNEVREIFYKASKNKTLKQPVRKEMALLEKKIVFFTAWANEQPNFKEVLSDLEKYKL